MDYHFYMEVQLTRQGYSELSICKHILENEQSEPVTSRKSNDSLCYNDKIQAFCVNSSILGNVFRLL